ncbi:MAG: DUF1592 domain-containing protein [Deltaproteobacteria bacterium]|nr:MAG: DUF1592 domain-containing protein [Deltaproteobacteria bacterium]
MPVTAPPTSPARARIRPLFGLGVCLAASSLVLAACGDGGDVLPESDGPALPSSGTPSLSDTAPSAAPDTDGPPATSAPLDPAACGAEVVPVRRLSHFEYRQTLRDLFPDVDLPNLDLPADNRPNAFDNDAESMLASSVLLERWMDIGLAIARTLGEDIRDLVDCRPAEEAPAEWLRCGEAFLRDFGTRVFRRPLSDDEVEVYGTFFGEPLDGAGFTERLQLTLQFLLAAPEFLYRIERPLEPLAPGEQGPLDPWALASRLSYFAWGSMPDDALLAAAADGSLLDPAVLREHATRLLADDRAREAFSHFHEQWFDVRRIQSTFKLPEDGLTEALRDDMREQARRFIHGVLFEEDGTVADLLASDRVFLNAPLAELYDVPVGATDDDGWFETRVDERVGMLTKPFFLASHAHPDKPSLVLRGAFVLERIMCVTLGAPPPNAESEAAAVEESIDGPLTNRQFYELITADAACTSCHQSINPIGGTFEHFDTMGRFRTHEPNGLPIDSHATLRDWSFTGAQDMMEQLSSDDTVDRCMVQTWTRYAWGGAPVVQSTCHLDDLRARYHAEGGSIRDLQLAIATHPHFATWVEPPAETP